MAAGIGQDVRYGLRTLGRTPLFATVAVLTLALGIGANATMFTLVNAVFLRRPPFVSAPGELMRFTQVMHGSETTDALAYPDYEYYRDRNDVFSGVLAYRYSRSAMTVGGGGQLGQARAGYVSWNYFDVLGVPLELGRPFSPEEDRRAAPEPVIIIGHGFWQRQFGSDPGVVGTTLLLDGNPFTVVGVAPEGFRGVNPVEETPDLFLPATQRGFGLERIDGQYSYSWNVLGRLRPGVDRSAAQTHADLLFADWTREFASWSEATAPPVERIVLASRFQFSPRVARALSRLMTLLSLVAGAVLLVACANVAILLLARATAREREIGVRSALGASWGRLVRQLLTESLLLAVVGGAGGLLLSSWGTDLAASLIPYSIYADLAIDWPVVLVTLALAVGTAVVFGSVPAWQLSRRDIVTFLARAELRRSRLTAHGVLVIAQSAISIVLVTAAVLFARSLMTARRVDLGFEPERKLLVAPVLPRAGYGPAESEQFVHAMLDRLAALPGVVGVTTTMLIPFTGPSTQEIIAPASAVADTTLEVGFNLVGPSYFEVMGTPIVTGRGLNRSDDPAAPPAAVVNQTLARRLWPRESALGKTIVFNEVERTVVGVARDAVYYEVGEPSQMQLFVPQLQEYVPFFDLVIATAGRPEHAVAIVEDAIHAYDTRIPIHRAAPLQQFVDAEFGEYRVMAVLASLCGGLVLLLTGAGLYGVQSYVVAQRTREIGLRIALGAAEHRVLRDVIGRGVVLVGIGILVGVAAALGLARLIEGMLFGVPAHDPFSFAVVPAILLAVAVMASAIPALRASRVNPVEALRGE